MDEKCKIDGWLDDGGMYVWMMEGWLGDGWMDG